MLYEISPLSFLVLTLIFSSLVGFIVFILNCAELAYTVVLCWDRPGRLGTFVGSGPLVKLLADNRASARFYIRNFAEHVRNCAVDIVVCVLNGRSIRSTRLHVFRCSLVSFMFIIWYRDTCTISQRRPIVFRPHANSLLNRSAILCLCLQRLL